MTNAHYEITLGNFKGPLEKLLELIEAQKLTITQISLAYVTDDFLKYLRGLEGEARAAGILSDFLVVAARLILIKSKALLPELPLTEEEEADVHDLEARLKLYREFSLRGGGGDRPAGAVLLKRLWQPRAPIHTRPLFMDLPHAALFYPPPSVGPGELALALRRLAAMLGEWQKETGTIENKVVSIQQKAEELLERLKKVLEHSFAELRHNRPRGEVVGLFLAILHLLKHRHIRAEQKGQFDDIMISRND